MPKTTEEAKKGGGGTTEVTVIGQTEETWETRERLGHGHRELRGEPNTGGYREEQTQGATGSTEHREVHGAPNTERYRDDQKKGGTGMTKQ